MSKRKPLIHIVRFDNDRAYITAINNKDGLPSAMVFFSDTAHLFAGGGVIHVCNLQELPTFIAKLPRYAGKLKKQLLKLQKPQVERIDLTCGKNGISITGTADVDRFIMQIIARYNELKAFTEEDFR